MQLGTGATQPLTGLTLAVSEPVARVTAGGDVSAEHTKCAPVPKHQNQLQKGTKRPTCCQANQEGFRFLNHKVCKSVSQAWRYWSVQVRSGAQAPGPSMPTIKGIYSSPQRYGRLLAAPTCMETLPLGSF